MTAPDHDTAERIVTTLVEERIIACGNIVPSVTSIYRWNDEIQQESEVVVLMKTSRARVMHAIERISELHPYDVPEAIAVDIAAGLPGYLSWIHENTREVDEG